MAPAVANGSTLYVSPTPNTVVVNFSNPVNKATVKATDLVLSGTDINPLNPVKAMSVTWLDNHTAQFNLTGQFNPLGTINVVLKSERDQESDRKLASDLLRLRGAEQRHAGADTDADSHADTDSHSDADAHAGAGTLAAH